MWASPRLLARIMSSEPKHERGHLLALALEVFLRCLTGAREISHSFMPLIGHPDRGQFPGAITWPSLPHRAGSSLPDRQVFSG